MTAHLPSGKRRSAYLRVRLTEADMALLRDTVAGERRKGRSVSKVVRELIIAYITKPRYHRAP